MVTDTAQNIVNSDITSEMKTSYLSYAMSVITGRALPDVRDGLKPVHRRILYAMMDLGLWHSKPYKKSARITGDCMGKYHPHGDLSVYDALVRMAQNFSLRYTLVEGQGNFGSLDGDPPASSRYTEARLSKIAEEMLVNLEKNTVDFVPNYDNSLKEPTVLPSKIPNLIVNGTSGIAVGMATNIPTHNLSEVCDALVVMIDKPEIETKEIMQYIKGPDFPTGATILNQYEMLQIYETGHGSVYIRSNYHLEEMQKGKSKIVFTDIPYKVNKSTVIEKIAKLVNDGILKGISDLRDESDKEGLRIVVETGHNAEPEIVVNGIFKHTDLETSFGVNLLVLDKGQPKVMNLKQILSAYLEHRLEVTKRWLSYDIEKFMQKLHILEGLIICINNLDEAIKIIKGSKDPATAKQKLIIRFNLDEIQAQAILDMKLQKLTGLEIDNLKRDFEETKKQIANYKEILNSETKLKNTIKNEILEIKQKYGDVRKTQILNCKTTKNTNLREFLENKQEVILLTKQGYIKRMNLEEYRTQNRAGKGIRTTKVEDDSIKEFVVANTHDVIYLFTNTGRLYTMDCFEVPEASRNSKGRFLANFLQLLQEEHITNLIPITMDVIENSMKYAVAIVTKKGKIKKMPFDYIKKIRTNGLRIATLNEKDEVISVRLLEEEKKLFITSFAGKAVLFNPEKVRVTGRTAAGVRAMNIGGSEIVSVNVVSDKDIVLFISKLGYGKKTEVSLFRETNRGAKGVKAMHTENAGGIVKTLVVTDSKEIMVVTDKGIAIRTTLEEIPELSRNTKGVRIIKLDKNDFVHDVDVINGNGD